MGSFSIWHWLIVLAVVIIIFGTKKLRNMGGDIGGAIRNFKQSMKEESEGKPEQTPPTPGDDKQIPGSGRVIIMFV
ncbi:MAG: Sec-independent protein translocase subunit TatA, partial [Pseudomonadota bacterium]